MTIAIGHDLDRADRRRRIWAIFGSSSGNLVEWYDFYAYAFTALYFAPSFFPDGNQTTQLLQTAAVFAIGFLMRPIGGYVFGFIADNPGATFHHATTHDRCTRDSSRFPARAHRSTEIRATHETRVN